MSFVKLEIVVRNFILLLFVFFSSVSYGMQIIEVGDNERMSAKISSSNLTRIFIDGDRISEVKGNAGEYLLNTDNKKGRR